MHITDVFFVRFFLFFIGETTKTISGGSKVSSAFNSHGRIGFLPLPSPDNPKSSYKYTSLLLSASSLTNKILDGTYKTGLLDYVPESSFEMQWGQTLDNNQVFQAKVNQM